MTRQLTIGSLFSGYGGLDMAVEGVFNAHTAWQAEWEDAPSKVLARHWPGVPNYRDVTAIDWAGVEPVDIITGGFPCQDVSLAGRRAGMTEGTRSNLWGAMRSAVETIRPTYVVAENVRGLLSAKAESDSDMEPGPGLLGDRSGGHLRALGRVLGDLADLGYDAQWCGLRASDVGAPHQRFRVFILATRADVQDALRSRSGWRSTQPGPTGCDHAPLGPGEGGGRAGSATADTGGEVGEQWAGLRTGEQEWERRARPDHGGSHAPDPAGDAGRVGNGDGGPAADAGGPAVREHAGGSPAQEAGAGCGDGPGDHRGERPTGERGQTPADPEGRGRGVLQRLDHGPTGGEVNAPWDSRPITGGAAGPSTDWGPYAPAIHRWEPIVGRRAPAPTELTARGKHRLSPRFVEFMMGLPAGWVTDIDISRNDQLKALGNGVLPQQAAAALRHMLAAHAA